MATNQLPDMSSSTQFQDMPPGGIATAVILALAGYLAKYLHKSGVVSFRRMMADIPVIMLVGFMVFMITWAFTIPQWQSYILFTVSGWIGTRMMDLFAKIGESRIKSQVDT